MKPLIIYVDMDDTLCDFRGAHAAALKKYPAIQYPQSQMDFFRSLEPFEGAIDAMQWMLEQEHLDPHNFLRITAVENGGDYTTALERVYGNHRCVAKKPTACG